MRLLFVLTSDLIYRLVYLGCSGIWLGLLDKPVPSLRFFRGCSWWLVVSLCSEVLLGTGSGVVGEGSASLSTVVGSTFSARSTVPRIELSESDSSSLVGTRLLDRITGTDLMTGLTRFVCPILRTTLFLVPSTLSDSAGGSSFVSSSLPSWFTSLSSLESTGSYTAYCQLDCIWQ